MRLFVAAAALAGLLSVWQHPVHAQITTGHLQFDPCLEVDAGEVARLLNLEIASRSTGEKPGVAPELRLTGRCPAIGDVVVELSGTDRVGQPLNVQRHFDWQRALPEARARLLAIGIAEMFPEPPSPPPPPPPASVVEPVSVIKSIETQPVKEMAAVAPNVIRFAAGAAFLSSGDPGIVLNAQIARRNSRGLGLGFALDGIQSATDTSIGGIRLGEVVFRAISIGPTASHEARARVVHARGQIGLMGGVASISGRSRIPHKVEGRTVYGFWGGPQVAFAAGFTVGQTWDLDLWIHAAYNLKRLAGRVVDATTETRGGLWYATGLGLGRRF